MIYYTLYTIHNIWQLCCMAWKAIYWEYANMRRQNIYANGVVGGKRNRMEYVQCIGFQSSLFGHLSSHHKKTSTCVNWCLSWHLKNNAIFFCKNMLCGYSSPVFSHLVNILPQPLVTFNNFLAIKTKPLANMVGLHFFRCSSKHDCVFYSKHTSNTPQAHFYIECFILIQKAKVCWGVLDVYMRFSSKTLQKYL